MPTPRRLSVATIVTTALGLLREGGLEAVTQRAVARKLGVEAASLYRHVPGKEPLLALVTQALFREQIDRIGHPPSWQAWLKTFGRTLWQTQRAIPDCARLVLTTRFSARDYDTMSRQASEPLIAYGLAPEAANQMHLAIQAIVLGLSGLAYGPNSELVRDIVQVELLLEESMDALIAGWQARLSSPVAAPLAPDTGANA